ncbi:uncharacterized protein PGTG_22605 [Puccinia graminis f. sp. tritici CRL 75-36-700-3]|uniref:Uncharacterized protein n=1 Tax=Puccinia graminis f. sp. tritici (strain CRL 75-36-700-3 / race SCCL) TaxID=418459 RepID=H6QV17_PUCGT|nr:uncharacterized protein PGTG_22605 [Puccinia graminis f. sp. tritici CRL 75-36-700-3]EHS62630.1 hypothetical protein PGTG_22605 [Puccinia graminis f. sp. tritici CRL 75-36-700-3]
MDMGSDGEPEKRLVVHHLPWRHPRIGRAFQMIDRLIDLQRQSGSRDYGKNSHARLRPRNPTISNHPAPPKLSHHAYCDEWIATLTVPQLDELDVQGHSLGTALKNLEGMCLYFASMQDAIFCYPKKATAGKPDLVRDSRVKKQRPCLKAQSLCFLSSQSMIASSMTSGTCDLNIYKVKMDTKIDASDKPR